MSGGTKFASWDATTGGRSSGKISSPRELHTVRPKTPSDLIPAARQIEFESCEKRPDSELSKEKWRNNSSHFFSKHVGLIHLADLSGPETFFL